MKSVCHLNSSGYTVAGCFGIDPTSIAADNLNRRMMGKPPFKRLGCPVRKQIHNAMPFQVNQYGSVFLPLAPRPVVHSQPSHHISIGLPVGSAFERSQNSIVTDRYREPFQNTASGPPASGIGHQMDDVLHACRPARITTHHARDEFGEDASATQPIATAEAADPQPQLDCFALPRQILQLSRVMTVHGSRGGTAFRAAVGLIYPGP